MEEKPDPATQKRMMICFWISVAVVLLVFVIPVRVVSGESTTRSYTLFNLIMGTGPSGGEVRVIER